MGFRTGERGGMYSNGTDDCGSRAGNGARAWELFFFHERNFPFAWREQGVKGA